jgi:leucyl-tRNA synthetase
MLFSPVKVLGEPFPVYYVNGLPKMIDANIYQLFTGSRKIFTNRRLPPLGNALVWAWDTAIKW